MKTFLTFFVLLFVSTNVWGAKGVDCSNVKTPDFSELDFTMEEKTVYDDKGLGVGFHYQSAYDSLTYYSFDLDLT